MRLKNKIAVITGSRRGLGLEVARLFFEEGATVIGIARHDFEDNIKNEVFKGSDKVVLEKVDITDPEKVKGFAHNIEKRFGKIDILVNNAGINSTGNIEEVSIEEFKETMTVNVSGTFFVTKYLIPLIRKNDSGGSIINVSSSIGVVGTKRRIAYTTSKGALNNFTRSMALDYAKYNIRVNAIAPGGINTDMVVDYFKQFPEEFRLEVCAQHALNRLAEPREIANGILFLASDESSYMTGCIMTIDGGFTSGK